MTLPHINNTIRYAVVHKLEKQRFQESTVVLRQTCLDIRPPLETLIDRVHRLYVDQPSKGYGMFEEDLDIYPTQRHVQQYYADKDINFHTLSVHLMNILRGKINQENLSTGGYVLMAHVTHREKEWLLIVMLTDVNGSAINDQLEVVSTVHLDLEHLRVAGRINLTGWQDGEDRYIGFLKGKAEVSEYFKHFLGCNDVVSASKETLKLVDTLKRFASEQKLDDASRDRFLTDARDYCLECIQKNTPLSIEIIANRLCPDQPEALQKVFAAPECELADGFIPDRRIIKSFVRFKAKTPTWSLEFDRKAIRNGELKFDKHSGTLTITSLPHPLLTELSEEITEDDV